MHWYLLIYSLVVPNGVTDCMPGACTPSQYEIKVAMPSQEICEQIKKLNNFTHNAHCWGTTDNLN